MGVAYMGGTCGIDRWGSGIDGWGFGVVIRLLMDTKLSEFHFTGVFGYSF